MKVYIVDTTEYITNTRVHPLGSEHYEDKNLVGIYPSRRSAYEGIKDFIRSICLSSIDQFIDDEFELNDMSLGTVNKINDNVIELRYSDDREDLVIFEIEEKEMDFNKGDLV